MYSYLENQLFQVGQFYKNQDGTILDLLHFEVIHWYEEFTLTELFLEPDYEIPEELLPEPDYEIPEELLPESDYDMSDEPSPDTDHNTPQELSTEALDTDHNTPEEPSQEADQNTSVPMETVSQNELPENSKQS